MGTGPKPSKGRGGARPGSGQKLKPLDYDFKERFAVARAKWENLKGIDFVDVLFSIAYESEKDQVRVAALKILVQATTIGGQADRQQEEIKRTAPVILPEKRPDPALQAVPKMKKAI